jgi:hypothetical protein
MTASRKPGARHIASNRRCPSACISVYPVEFVLELSSCELAPHTLGGYQAPQTPAALPRSPSRTAPRSLFHRETRRQRDVALLRPPSHAMPHRLSRNETRRQRDAAACHTPSACPSAPPPETASRNHTRVVAGPRRSQSGRKRSNRPAHTGSAAGIPRTARDSLRTGNARSPASPGTARRGSSLPSPANAPRCRSSRIRRSA